MQTLLQDLRYGARMIFKSKAFALVTILSLALGIGANTALFSAMDAVMLKTLPVRDPQQLVLLRWVGNPDMEISMSGSTWQEQGKPTGNILPWPIYQQLKQQTQTLESLCAFYPLEEISANINGQAEVVAGQMVTGNYFSTLGVSPLIGRLLEERDDQVAAESAAVISHRYWQKRFGADPEVIGRQISLNKKSFTIVGVTPPEFFGALNVGYVVDISVPVSAELFPAFMAADIKKPDFWWALVMGRLKPGVSRQQAQADLSVTGVPMLQATQTKASAEAGKWELVADSGSQGLMEARRNFSLPLKILFSVVIAALLIACLNIANLTLARGATRQREMAVRMAAGATRWRLIRQILTESVLLALAGGALGILFAFWTKDLILNFNPGEGGAARELFINAQIDWRVLAFTAAAAILTGLVFGLIPAWRVSQVNPARDLKENSHQVTSTTTRITKAFLIAQIALSLVLLTGAGLFLSTLRNLQTVNPGFDQENLLLFKVQPELNGYKAENALRLYAQMSERIEALPEVRAVTHSLMPVIGAGGFYLPLKISGRDEKSDTGSWIHHVRYNFIDAMKIRVLAGRSLSAQDTRQSRQVAVINQAAAKKLFGAENPLGKLIGVGPESKGSEAEIVGVVSDAKYDNLRKEAPPTTYLSAAQFTEFIAGQATFAVRTERNPVALASAVRETVRQLDPNLPVTEMRSQEEQNARTFTQEKLFAQLTTFFGLLMLALVNIGLYGMMSYSVAQRHREVGIRLALGAQTGDVLRMILRQGMIVVLFGVVSGGIAALGVSHLLTGFLFGVSATEPRVFLLTSLLLLMVALFACWIPARRAARTDPMIALRCE